MMHVSEVMQGSEDQFFQRVDRLARRFQRDLECCDRSLVACCDITVAQSYALLALQELGIVTMNEFAAQMRLHGTTMTRMVDALVEKGLVERRSDAEDRRIVRVALSPAGEAMVRSLQESQRLFLSLAFADFSASERAMVLKVLERMVGTFEKLSGQCCG